MSKLSIIPMAATAAVAESTAVFDLSTIMSGAVDSVKGDALLVLAIVVPAIVVIVGAKVGVNFGLNWLKKLGK